MVVRIVRTVDCKMKVEESLRNLGYDTNPTDQTSLHNKECVVKYSNVKIDIYTQEEYEMDTFITVEFNIDNNNELPYVIYEMIKNVTYDVEQATVPWCTSFQFVDSDCRELGTTHNVLLTAKFMPIYDWVWDR